MQQVMLCLTTLFINLVRLHPPCPVAKRHGVAIEYQSYHLARLFSAMSFRRSSRSLLRSSNSSLSYHRQYYDLKATDVGYTHVRRDTTSPLDSRNWDSRIASRQGRSPPAAQTERTDSSRPYSAHVHPQAHHRRQPSSRSSPSPRPRISPSSSSASR